MYHRWKPYVPVSRRRANAQRKVSNLRASGQPVAPVEVNGRQIVHTFWGRAWCDNLERYSDFANRLPRGRTYVRNGSVIDLQIAPGKVNALVSGSEIYEVAITIPRVASRQWVSICDDCGSSVKSLVELLQGRLSDGVMERICRPTTGLFPEPSQIDFRCSCPDWAWMCKHVAAVLYGVGVRLDKHPDLLFKLRDVDAQELVDNLDADITVGVRAPASDRVLEQDGLSELFGLELAASPPAPESKQRERKRRTAKKAAKATPRKQLRAAVKPKGTKPATSRARGTMARTTKADTRKPARRGSQRRSARDKK